MKITASLGIYIVSLIVTASLLLALYLTDDKDKKFGVTISIMVFIFIACIAGWQNFCNEANGSCDPNGKLIAFIISFTILISLIISISINQNKTHNNGLFIAAIIFFVVSNAFGYAMFHVSDDQ